MTNFAYSKVGLNLNFEFCENKGNFFSGADDWVRLSINLSFNNPNDNFYIIVMSNHEDLNEDRETIVYILDNIGETLLQDHFVSNNNNEIAF